MRNEKHNPKKEIGNRLAKMMAALIKKLSDELDENTILARGDFWDNKKLAQFTTLVKSYGLLESALSDEQPTTETVIEQKVNYLMMAQYLTKRLREIGEAEFDRARKQELFRSSQSLLSGIEDTEHLWSKCPFCKTEYFEHERKAKEEEAAELARVEASGYDAVAISNATH